MHQGSKQFGVKATNSFKKSFNQSLLKLSFLYGTILVTILTISGIVTFNEFSNRIGKRFKDIQPTITIQLPNGDRISNKPIQNAQEQFIINSGGVEIFATETIPQIKDKQLNKNKLQLPTAEDIRNDLIAALIFVNGILILVASFASYWLAQKTLRPIRDSYERQRRFLGDASHELRTPLSILQIELENELHTANDKEKEQIESKLDEVKRMSKLVGDLLTISRLDEGTQARQNQSKNLDTSAFSKIIENITTRLSTLAHSHNVTLNLHNKISNQSKLIIPLDENLFSHAITNLIQNAIFYNKKDGTVDITLKNENKKVIIEIKDNGIGINKQDLERIFDRFYQADISRTRKNTPNEGSGLGLSIAKSALLYMGGNLEIQSEPNIGTTVYIEIKTI